MTQRKSNWEQELSDYLISKREEPFKYGSHDCAHFVAGAIEAMTGENPMSDITVNYKSQLGSLKLLKTLGFDNVEQFMDSKFTSVFVGFAQTGDVALHDGCLGVVISSKAVFVGEIGYTFVDRADWSNVWEVGRG